MSKQGTYLQKNLRNKLSETGISAHALEKQAGLKRSAVQNILYGKSKKPSAEILRAITRVLGCSINELLGQDNTYIEASNPLESVSDPCNLDIGLYTKAVQVANSILQARQLTTTKQETLDYINEIYNYSLNAHQHDIDKHFANWLAQKMWHK